MDSKHIKWGITSGSTLLTGLVGYWKLDEDSGDILDSLELHDGTKVNTITQGYTPAKIGKCISGVSTGHFDCGTDDSAFGFTGGGFSISFWLYTNGYTTECLGYQQAVDPDYDGWSCGVYNVSSTARPRFIIWRTPGADLELNGNTTDLLYRWGHLVFTFDTSYYARIYVDSELDCTPTESIATVSYQTGTKLLIGRNNPTSGNPLEGYLDEIGIWNKCLTQDEITELYNSGSGKTYPFS